MTEIPAQAELVEGHAPSWPQRLLVIGCGNMGGAMLAGWLAGGLAPERFTVLDPRLAQAPEGVRLERDAAALTSDRFDAVLIGIKPQGLAEAAPVIAALTGTETIILSILAGTEIETLSALFPEAGGIARIMPNLAAAIGKSPVALFAPGLDSEKRDAVLALTAPLGTPEWLDNEDQFHAVTALAGSGPAFVYRFIDALAAGGVSLGLDGAQAQRLAAAMVEGAALLAAAAPDSPAELARKVASPGGTTQAGLDVLDAGQAITRLLAATLAAAARRNAEMAEATRG
jgi:pyrroline-5-carboxylate reductase